MRSYDLLALMIRFSNIDCILRMLSYTILSPRSLNSGLTMDSYSGPVFMLIVERPHITR